MQDSEAYLGADDVRSSPIEDDIVMHRFITDRRNVEVEMDLFQSKWFDYRFMTPLQATRTYIQKYDDVYRQHYARNMDATAAKFVKTVSVDGIFAGLAVPESSTHKKAKTQFTACWFGRQLADAMGMPYEIFIDLAFNIRLRYWNRAYLPQPQHLYSEMIEERAGDRWKELQAGRLYTSDHPAFIGANYSNLPVQNDYHEWLLSQALTRANPGEILGRFINQDVLPAEKVKARVSEGIFNIARSYVE